MDPLLILRFAQTAAAVVLVGTLLLRLLARGSEVRNAPRWNGLAWSCLVTLVVTGIGVLGWTTASMTGETWREVLHDNSLENVLAGTRFGTVWRVRAGLLVGLFIAGFLPTMRRSRAPIALDSVHLLLAATVLVTLPWAGHARASARSAWLLPADVLHVLAAGAWPGGLLPLLLLLARTRRNPTLLRAASAIAARYSRVSVAAVAVLSVSGLLNAAGMVGGFAALWTDAYGRLLLCKAALFAAMVGVGAWNYRLIRQRVPRDAPATTTTLYRNVGWECTLAVGVLLAAEALAMSPPPH